MPKKNGSSKRSNMNRSQWSFDESFKAMSLEKEDFSEWDCTLLDGLDPDDFFEEIGTNVSRNTEDFSKS